MFFPFQSLVEEHILEVELAEGQKEVTRIAFLQRLSDEIYFGEQSDGNMKGEKCRSVYYMQHV